MREVVERVTCDMCGMSQFASVEVETDIEEMTFAWDGQGFKMDLHRNCKAKLAETINGMINMARPIRNEPSKPPKTKKKSSAKGKYDDYKEDDGTYRCPEVTCKYRNTTGAALGKHFKSNPDHYLPLAKAA